jgi:hypothetical protein
MSPNMRWLRLQEVAARSTYHIRRRGREHPQTLSQFSTPKVDTSERKDERSRAAPRPQVPGRLPGPNRRQAGPNRSWNSEFCARILLIERTSARRPRALSAPPGRRALRRGCGGGFDFARLRRSLVVEDGPRTCLLGESTLP